MNPPSLHDDLAAFARKLLDEGLFHWTNVKPPNEEAMRAFQGQAKSFLLLAVQANVRIDTTAQGEPLNAVRCFCKGMYTGTWQGKNILVLINLNSAEADYFYHKAAASQN